jgi:hypothetical protein
MPMNSPIDENYPRFLSNYQNSQQHLHLHSNLSNAQNYNGNDKYGDAMFNVQ